MENRQDLNSILEFLPPLVLVRSSDSSSSSSLSWPCQVIESLKSLSRGPDHSRVDSGQVLFLAITDIRESLFGPSTCSSEPLAFSAQQGYSVFFDELLSRVEAQNWFGEIIPMLASLLLRFPSLLQAHYQYADDLVNGLKQGFLTLQTGLRLLDSQQPGIVFLNQELIAALLACSFFCLFPTTNRSYKHLPDINMDYLFASLCPNYSSNQEHKIKCLVHYFERISSCMPMGFVSFERKVLVKDCSVCVSYQKADFWSKSSIPLCCFEVSHSGLIEDHLSEALEVDFANKYIGGGALSRGCVQEEIRFMINPELIVGMLFLPSMADNEAVEIVGVERFSNYTGYGSSFRFSGDYVDKKPIDCMRRRKTRIVAIDALCSPRMRQYGTECLLREINKAFCGFFDPSKYRCCQKFHQDDEFFKDRLDPAVKGVNEDENFHQFSESLSSTGMGPNENAAGAELIQNSHDEHGSVSMDPKNNIGIVTGNWGCGAFGGDPELKAVIQWLASSQALRPFILYYTFREESLQNLDQVSEWILTHGWTVGDLWNMLTEYSSQRLKGETHTGFFRWLLPPLKGGHILG